MAKSVDPDQTAPLGAVCSGSTLFASILNLSVMLGNYLQQTTSAKGHFQMFFFLGTLRAKCAHWQKVKTQMKCSKMQQFIWVYIYVGFSEKEIQFYLEILTPLYIYNGPSQDYSIKPEGRIH